MKGIILEALTIENFKGIKKMHIKFSKLTRITGANASGKSSIVDAFCWLLFNKDSHGNASGSDNFHEKPLDAEGHEIHNLTTMVQAMCYLDGEPFILRREQTENWVRQRGTSNPVFKGNESHYWINEVETPKGDFQKRIASIAGDDVFILLTSLGAFNGMAWKQRRAVLLAMTNCDVDAELLKRDEFQTIAEEARKTGVSIDQLRDVLAVRRREINRELTECPARIDEAKRSIPVVTDEAVKDAEFVIKDSQTDLDTVNRMIAEEQSQNGLAESSRRLAEMTIKLSELQSGIEKKWRTDTINLKRQIAELDDTAKKAERDANLNEVAMAQSELQKGLINDRLKKLREDYKTAYALPFVAPENLDICPNCGQKVPEEKLQKMLAALKAKHDVEKKQNLELINKKGQVEKIALENVQAKIDDLKAKAEAARFQGDEAEAKIAELNKELSAFGMYPDTNTPEIMELQAEISRLKAEQDSSPEGRLQKLQARKADIMRLIDTKRQVLAKVELAKEQEARVHELEQGQTELGVRLTDVESMIVDVERFITERCAAVEELINQKFISLRWKLFDIQINGGIKDCCECMIASKGSLVPYSGANTAARVNADIEIINVLSDHYGVSVPLFVDNAERVNKIAQANGQMIELAVGSNTKLLIEEVA